jgi:uncharacterized protein YrrD
VGTIQGDRLLRLPVRLRGIELGRPVDILLDLEGGRALGLEVACGDAARRFLALSIGDVREDEIAIGSSLTLLEERELVFYRQRARSLASLRGAPVLSGRRVLGTLVDVVVAPDGVIAALVVDGEDGERTVPYDETIRLGAGRSAA